MKFALASTFNDIVIRRTVKSILLLINVIGIVSKHSILTVRIIYKKVIGASMIAWVMFLGTIREFVNLPYSFGFVDHLLKYLAIMGFFILAMTLMGCVGVIIEGIHGKWLSTIHTILVSVIVTVQIYVLVILLLFSTGPNGLVGTVGLRFSGNGLQIARTGLNTIRSNPMMMKLTAESDALDEDLFYNEYLANFKNGDNQNSDESQEQQQMLPFLSNNSKKSNVSIFEVIPITSHLKSRNTDTESQNVFASIVGSANNNVVAAVGNVAPTKQMKGIMYDVLHKGIHKIGGIVDKTGSALRNTKRKTKENIGFAKLKVITATKPVIYNISKGTDLIKSTITRLNPLGKVMSGVQKVSKKINTVIKNNLWPSDDNMYIKLLKPLLGVLTRPVIFASRSFLVMACFVIINIIEVLYIILMTMFLCTMELHSAEAKQEVSVS